MASVNADWRIKITRKPDKVVAPCLILVRTEDQPETVTRKCY